MMQISSAPQVDAFHEPTRLFMAGRFDAILQTTRCHSLTGQERLLMAVHGFLPCGTRDTPDRRKNMFQREDRERILIVFTVGSGTWIDWALQIRDRGPSK